jgi:putative ABC transport system permease protein
MMRPRWRKVLADLWGNKVRLLLVVASISVGLFAVGMIDTIREVLTADMRSGYAAVNPANIQISVNGFDQDLVDQVRHTPGVKDAAGVFNTALRLNAGSGQWIAINIQAITNFKKMNINQVTLEQGTWPPKKNEIAIDRNKLPDTHAKVGDKITFELPSGKTRTLTLTGVVHDQTIGSNGVGSGFFLAPVQGYISNDTLASIEMPDTFNQLYVTVTGDPNDLDHINQVANAVRVKVEDSGATVVNVIARRAIDHPNATYLEAMTGVLLILGLLVVFLSGFLITNTLSALLNQQVQQIGIMKTIGARRGQVILMYMLLILGFGVLAFLVALPLSSRASFALLGYLADRINFNLQGYRLVPLAVFIQLAIALIVPQVAAFLPILHGSRISVQEAISGVSRAGVPGHHKGWLDRQMRRVKGVSRPLLISLRNTFRRKGRLALTLFTLSLGGAIFIATFNVRATLDRTVTQVGHYFLADVNLTLDQPYHIDRIRAALKNIPEIADVEGWQQIRCEVVLQDGKVGDSLLMLGPPVGSRMIQPVMLTGRWLLPGDHRAVALSERFISRFPNIHVGDTIRFHINGQDTDWTVVGFFQLAGKSGGFMAYTNFDSLADVLHTPDQAVTYRIVSTQKGLDDAGQTKLGEKIETYLRAHNYKITDITTGQHLSASAGRGLNILTVFLLIMALLMALVGSIGLMGTMSLNVMERTREIGILRAIGASDGSLMRMVIVEGMLIGMLSCAIGFLLAVPISIWMSDTVSTVIFDHASPVSFTPNGFAIWLAIVVVLSLLASLIPAGNAARLTIREVLSYE